MSKHTPGPWRSGDRFATIFGPPNGNPSPETIANVAVRNRQANALLVSLAPEMYEALATTSEILGAMCIGTIQPEYRMSEMRRALHINRAILNKLEVTP